MLLRFLDNLGHDRHPKQHILWSTLIILCSFGNHRLQPLKPVCVSSQLFLSAFQSTHDVDDDDSNNNNDNMQYHSTIHPMLLG